MTDGERHRLDEQGFVVLENCMGAGLLQELRLPDHAGSAKSPSELHQRRVRDRGAEANEGITQFTADPARSPTLLQLRVALTSAKRSASMNRKTGSPSVALPALVERGPHQHAQAAIALRVRGLRSTPRGVEAARSAVTRPLPGSRRCALGGVQLGFGGGP
jgi:hypothetical protein